MNDCAKRLLLVEDDESICARLVSALAEASFTVEVCGTLAEAKQVATSGFALILLDLGLPDGDGLDLCHGLRAADDGTPIIVLTARDAPAERVAGLEAGADDYITKPLHVPELAARIRAVLRRATGGAADMRVSVGELWLDRTARTAGVGERVIELRRKEFQLLEFLIRSQGRTWTRAQLLERVWDMDDEGETRTVDIHIARLRAQIEADPARPRRIETIWGVGYRLNEER